jgi:hypothetical protein
MVDNAPSAEPSPQGRRILVAVVTDSAGAIIQAWREKHDSAQARRLPPHTTLCYWAPPAESPLLERQVRHAFADAVQVTLGRIREFENEEETFYVEVLDTNGLNRARKRLYDGTFLELPSRAEWTWHVTCVRDSRGRDKDALRLAAAELPPSMTWTIDTVAYMELRGDCYEPLAMYEV